LYRVQAVLPFVHERTFITITTSALDPRLSATMGNLQNPAYVASAMQDYPRPFSMYHRAKSVFMNIAIDVIWRNNIVNPTQVEVS
jgi:hypothetical protein